MKRVTIAKACKFVREFGEPGAKVEVKFSVNDEVSYIVEPRGEPRPKIEKGSDYKLIPTKEGAEVLYHAGSKWVWLVNKLHNFKAPPKPKYYPRTPIPPIGMTQEQVRNAKWKDAIDYYIQNKGCISQEKVAEKFNICVGTFKQRLFRTNNTVAYAKRREDGISRVHVHLYLDPELVEIAQEKGEILSHIVNELLWKHFRRKPKYNAKK